MTRAFRKRTWPPAAETLPAWSFKVRASFGEVACQAGATPNTTPVRRERPKVKANTRTSGVAVSGRSAELASRVRRALPVHHAKMIPTAPPARERTRLSAINWRTSTKRLAPTARRMAISFCLPTARASSRFATFAQAMSSRTADDPEEDEERIGELFAQVGKASAGRGEDERFGGEPAAAALRAELDGLHLHNQETVVVGFHAGLRLAQGDTGTKPADQLQPKGAPVVKPIPGGRHLGLHHGGHQDVHPGARVETVISRCGYTDDGHGVAVEQHGLIEQGGIAVEARFPKVVSQHDHGMGGGHAGRLPR